MATLVTSSGYTITVDATGISSVVKGGQTVAAHGFTLYPADAWFADATFDYPHLAHSSVLTESGGAVVVFHVLTGGISAQVVYRYTLSGNDLTITMQILNTGTVTLKKVGCAGPWWDFDGSHQPTYVEGRADRPDITKKFLLGDGSEGVEYMFPSSTCPSAAFAFTGTTMTGAQVIGFSGYIQGGSTERIMHFVDPQTSVQSWGTPSWGQLSIKELAIRPQETRSMTAVYRFAATGTQDALLSGYKAWMRATFPVAYTIDARPWVQFAYIDSASIRADNPYGYHDSGGGPGSFRRFDTQAGAAGYSTALLADMQTAGCQGIMGWMWTGIPVHPAADLYRADFDYWPPPFDDPAHVPWTHELCDPFTGAGLKMGFLSQPSARLTTDTFYDSMALAPQGLSPRGLRRFLDRWSHMVSLGFTADSYMDTFPGAPEDQAILEAIRTWIGPAAQLYTEQSTAMSAAFAGTYLEVNWNGSSFYTDSGTEICQYIYPEVPLLASIRGFGPGYLEVYTFCYQNKMSPLIADYQLNAHKSILATLNATYIHPTTHQWL